MRDVDPAAHAVTLDSGEQLAYQKVLIATGGRNRRLRIPGAELPGIHYLRTVAECDAIKREAVPGRRAVVVGMGFIGCEVAASLTQLGSPGDRGLPGPGPAGEGPGRPGWRADRRHSTARTVSSCWPVTRSPPSRAPNAWKRS